MAHDLGNGRKIIAAAPAGAARTELGRRVCERGEQLRLEHARRHALATAIARLMTHHTAHTVEALVQSRLSEAELIDLHQRMIVS